jgi:hypothetical protein
MIAPGRLRRTKRALLALSVAVATSVLFVGLAPGASAGSLPSTTKVVASPNPVGLDANVALTASVKVLNLPGLGIVPTGTVTFSSDTVGVLGSAPLGTCVLKTCKATLNVAFLPLGDNVVTASWPGDAYGAASSGQVTVTVDLTTYQTKSTVPCPKGSDSCDAGLIDSPDGGTWADLFTNGESSTKHTLSESLSNGSLKCADSNAGDLATFNDSPDVQGLDKELDYTVTDPVEASNVIAAFNSHPTYLGCFASHTPFISGKTGQQAPKVMEGLQTFYEAPLPTCESNGFAAPCVVVCEGVDQYGNFVDGDSVMIEVLWEQGNFTSDLLPLDPKYIG